MGENAYTERKKSTNLERICVHGNVEILLSFVFVLFFTFCTLVYFIVL